jgi:hypothetical protein
MYEYSSGTLSLILSIFIKCGETNLANSFIIRIGADPTSNRFKIQEGAIKGCIILEDEGYL